MGKLTKYLEDIRRGGQGIGFGASRQQKLPSLALVVALGKANPNELAATTAAGADAVMVAPANGDLTGLFGQLDGDGGMRARGVVLDGGTAPLPDSPKAWGEAGVDFVVFGEEQPAALLAGEVDKVARVAMDFDPVHVRALEALESDAFLLWLSRPEAGARLTVKDLIRVRLLVGSTGKPVLVGLGDRALVADLEALMQAGVEGVALDGDSLDAEAVKSFRQAIDALGPRRQPRRRGGEELPLIPRVPSTPAGPGEGEEVPPLGPD